jgi:hypothetical protein
MEIKTDSLGNPVLDQFSEEGFVDLTFRIRELFDDGKNYHFHLSAVHEEQIVGMSVSVAMGIQAGFDQEMNLNKDHVYRRGVVFSRTGEESDRLVTAIRDLYGDSGPALQMVSEESFTAIALHQGEIDMDLEGVKLKIFGKDGEPFVEDDYYESFFNIDLPNGYVYWNEKDPDYRAPLLRGITAVK